LGQMRCMEALGDWWVQFLLSSTGQYSGWNLKIELPNLFKRDQLQTEASTHWAQLEDVGRESMSRMAAAAAWGLEQWDSMERYVSCIPKDSTDGAFYRAVLAVHNKHFPMAEEVFFFYIWILYRFSHLVLSIPVRW
jgi:FKBP12-rapamycin complex-associated protein